VQHHWTLRLVSPSLAYFATPCCSSSTSLDQKKHTLFFTMSTNQEPTTTQRDGQANADDRKQSPPAFLDLADSVCHTPVLQFLFTELVLY
jgi:hypothetical protein